MHLDITYIRSLLPQKESAQAVFINSNDPRVWLTELSRWGNSAANWACYAVPESLPSVSVSGLFVVTEMANSNVFSSNILWFNKIGKRLFIPVDAQLTPSVSEAELDEILIFDVQLFHPTIGWVGFNRADRLDLTQLLEMSVATDADWTHAHEGLPPRPKLQEISILPPSGRDVVQSFKEGMEQKPLKDIPMKDGSAPKDGQSAFEKLMDDFKEQLLRGGYAALEALNDILPENTSDKPSLMDTLNDWLNERRAALAQKRESAIQRLLDLFQNDPDEALKYALPLNDPYEGRGTARPGGELGTHSTDFNLGQIGSGHAVDDWNAGQYYYDLRKKYLDAANRAIENEDYRRAAYIHAHLLGDFMAAANVLEQGGFYREAAALYRDHLNNLAGAAQCLEKGGLHLEAIELYQKLEQNEKVGDLYQHIGQTKNATFFYEKCVEKAINQKNFIEAARLENGKLGNATRAKATLLRGWSEPNANNAESCLNQYFDLLMLDSDEEAARQIVPIFKNSPEQHLSFLGVLINTNHRYANPHFQNAARPIAYQILSKEAAAGNRSLVKDLEHFLPNDALIGKDTTLFMHQKLRKAKVIAGKESLKIQVSGENTWFKVFSFYDCFVVIGINYDDFDTIGYVVNAVRSDWSGDKIQVESKTIQAFHLDKLHLTSNQKQSNQDHILMWVLYGSMDVFSMVFNRNEIFSSDLKIFSSLEWMPDYALAAGIYDDSRFLVLHLLNDDLLLRFYSIEGELLKLVDCLEDNKPLHFSFPFEHPISLLFYKSGCLSHDEQCLFFIHLHGKVERIFIGYSIEKVVQSTFEKNIFIIATKGGILVFDLEKADFKNIPNEAYFFGQNIEVMDILFVSPTDFVVLQKDEAIIFTRTETGATQKRKKFLKHPPLSILRTNERTQFAIFYQNGLVEFFD